MAEKRRAARYAYEGLDRLLHEPSRLAILTCLMARSEGLRFGEIREFCDLTDGNLSRHIQVLNEAGMLEIWKGFHGKRPQTICRMSKNGRRRFQEYLQALEGVILDARMRFGRAKGQGESFTTDLPYLSKPDLSKPDLSNPANPSRGWSPA